MAKILELQHHPSNEYSGFISFRIDSPYHVSKKEMSTYSSILAWSITWIEELDGLQSMVSVELDTTSMNTMAPHSSTLAWKIPWMEGPGGLQSMGS